MSSVVISGDISGSVTLDAPSVAGTTVLTLPATSGTVVTTATSSGISGSAITTGTVGVSVGGTGANTLTANNVILGNGTSAVQFVAPGSSGNVLTSNGTTWTSAAAGGGSLQTQLFTSPGTWTRPSTVTQVRVTVVGGGGGGSDGQGRPAAPGGNTSSFGSLVSATGGGGAGGPGTGPAGAMGTGTVTTGTALVSGNQKYASGLGLINSTATNGILTGLAFQPGTSGTATYSDSSRGSAGAGGLGVGPTPSNTTGGFGGVAMAICPVSAPVAITVGSGGAPNFAPSTAQGHGTSGAVVVEWVG